MYREAFPTIREAEGDYNALKSKPTTSPQELKDAKRQMLAVVEHAYRIQFTYLRRQAHLDDKVRLWLVWLEIHLTNTPDSHIRFDLGEKEKRDAHRPSARSLDRERQVQSEQLS
jgi:hypothetical protein